MTRSRLSLGTNLPKDRGLAKEQVDSLTAGLEAESSMAIRDN